MDELKLLTEYCRKLGAAPQQAEVMAEQLLKRADQLTIERRQTREECMAYLLRLVAQGSAGSVPAEFNPDSGKSK